MFLVKPMEHENLRCNFQGRLTLRLAQCANGKNARRRHNKMSAEDLNNVQAIREFVRRQVFPHYKLKEPGSNKWCVEPKTISPKGVAK